jgi:hypothetical protein
MATGTIVIQLRGSGTWVAPANLIGGVVQVECTGAGGSGHAQTAGPTGGGGGGGGEYSKTNAYPVTPGNSYAFSAPVAVINQAGGDATFDGSGCVGKGGAVSAGSTGAAGGTGGTGDTKNAGGAGAAGTAGPSVGGGGGGSGNAAGVGTAGVASAPGTGGATGGIGAIGAAVNTIGNSPGAGGGGGGGSLTAGQFGAKGGDALIVLTLTGTVAGEGTLALLGCGR